MESIKTFITSGQFFEVLLVIVIEIVLLRFIKAVLIKQIAYRGADEGKKRNTFLGMVFDALQYIVIIVGIFVVLSVFKIDITGMIAGLGIVATIVGLSLQDTFKDLFAGINIYGNNFYKVGDFVRYNGEICEVKFFNARISKFSSIATNATYTVSNSTVYNIEKVKDTFAFKFTFDFEDDKEKVIKALDNVTAAIEKTDHVKSASNFGIINIDVTGVTYAILVKVSPKYYLNVALVAYSNAYDEFKKADVIPSFDQDVNIKGALKK